MKIRTVLAAAALALLASCGSPKHEHGVDTSVYGAGDNWDNPGGDWAESHYSRLETIDAKNVRTLGLAWQYDLGTNRVQEATPVVIDGVMYTSGNLGRVYALDAATGKELWTFDPHADMQFNRYACCDQANRGVAVSGGKVFVGSLDGWLYALDAKTGKIDWKADTFVDRSRGYTITGAPEVAGNLVIIGNGGAEYDTRGYVTAYEVADGQMAWRWYTIPHDPKLGPQETEALTKALKTWDPNSRWDIGGGGTAWDAIVYDPQFDQVIIGTGNGGPYPESIRSPSGGDNLYLDSLVALDRKTGKMKWFYQETPQDNWDLTAVQPMILADMEIKGEKRPVVLQAPKNGFMYVIDRQTGKPIEANALVRIDWADGIDPTTGHPNMTPDFSVYSDGPKIVFPASAGARNWYPAAFDPEHKLYVASVLDMGNLLFIPPGQANPQRRKQAMNASAALVYTPDLESVMPTLPPAIQEQVKDLPQWKWVKDKPWSNEIRAIDPLTGKTRWSVPREGWQDRSGVLATKSGLVVYGTLSGKLEVRETANGRLLKAIDTGSSIMAAPMTYKVDGVQYIAVQTGWGGGGWGFVPPYSAAYKKGNENRILVFKLDGGEVPIPPDLPPLTVAPAPPPQFKDATPAMIAEGAALFTPTCSICHSNQPRAPLPDLKRMDKGVHAQFNQIVLGGALVQGGMPRWDDLLTPKQVHAIHAYLIDAQGKLREKELKLKKEGKPLDTTGPTILSSF